MADIRINALATTATSTASDDYIAIDGSANGTRKLSAYSPTFGGNLTVSGTAINLSTNDSTDKVVSIGYSTVPLYLTSSYDGSTFALSGFSANSRPSGSSYTTPSNTSYGNLYFLAKIAASNTASAFEWKHAPITAGTPVTTSLMTLNGSGNLLIGTTTDSANGKLQLATHTTSAGGIGFGTDTSLYRTAAADLSLDGTGGADAVLRFKKSGIESLKLEINVGSSYITAQGTMYLRSANAVALTLDSSQNATFAGTGTSSFAGNLNIKGALGAHQTAALNLAYEGSSVSQLVAYGADASTLGRVNVILRKAGTGTDAVTGLSVRDFGIITQGGVAQTPASASATGAAGTIQWDASYIYICTATNTWKRVAIATW